MADFLGTNNASSSLVAGIAAGDLALTVLPADAAKFPTPGANQYFLVTLVHINTLAKEIVKVTANAAGVFTIVRAQENTAALAFSAGDVVSLRFTAGLVGRCSQATRQLFVPLPSANDLPAPAGYGYIQVSGNTQINRIINTGWNGGDVLILKFNGAPTVKNNQAAAGAARSIITKSGADVVEAAGKLMSLRYDELDNVFYEV